MKLIVYYDKLRAGVLEQLKDLDSTTYKFYYLPEYLLNSNARPVSVNLPLQEAEYTSDKLFPFFDNLLAEGWLLDLQIKQYKIDTKDRFALIHQCGLECLGAVSLRGEQDVTLP